MTLNLKLIAGILALTGVVATAPAQAACWTSNAISAAKVREFETVLMVSALRCKASGGAMLSNYNKFVRASRPALTEANDQLRAHFERQGSGLGGYDRYVTSLANRYGAGGGFDCNEAAQMVHAALAGADSIEKLERLADRAQLAPVESSRSCPVTFAQKR
jgi:hypothetical protein